MHHTFLKSGIFYFTLLVSALLTGCGALQKTGRISATPAQTYRTLSAADQALADTLIKNVLDNEGLFTVISRLKPISSAGDIRLCLSDTATADHQKYQRYQRIVNVLQFGDLRFVISPFRMHEGGQRMIQINVYRQSLVDSMVLANNNFYRQLGYVAGGDARLIINTTEYEEKLVRFRSYGNLFGYPPHAVDFFVAAEQTKAQTGKFVERDFYQIPVYSKEKGRFVYALAKGSRPNDADSAIKARAAFSLSLYRSARRKYVNRDSTLRAYELLKRLLRHGEN